MHNREKHPVVFYIGLSELFAEQLDEVEFVSLPKVGEVYSEDGLFTIETISDTFHFTSPVSGKIIEVNEDLENNPKLIVEDPEFEGWVCKIKITDKSELDDLLTFDKYRNYLENKDEYYD
jgi:glycine cleavage system H protein